MFCILFLLYYLCSMFIVKKQISENIVALMLLLLTACSQQVEQHRVVLCIPVYGQSLALGEEAERLTDFDSLAAYADGRIVTENLDHHFGYFDNDGLKQWVKKTIGYKKRAYELSVYKMAQVLADHLGKDTLICIFPSCSLPTVHRECQDSLRDRPKERLGLPSTCYLLDARRIGHCGLPQHLLS